MQRVPLCCLRKRQFGNTYWRKTINAILLASTQMYWRHTWKHTLHWKKSYKCDHCNYECFYTSSLKSHKRINADGKPKNATNVSAHLRNYEYVFSKEPGQNWTDAKKSWTLSGWKKKIMASLILRIVCQNTFQHTEIQKKVQIQRHSHSRPLHLSMSCDKMILNNTYNNKLLFVSKISTCLTFMKMPQLWKWCD